MANMLLVVGASLLPVAALSYGRTTPGSDHAYHSTAHAPLTPPETVRSADMQDDSDPTAISSGTHGGGTATTLLNYSHLKLGVDINISSDNPFFMNGVPYFTEMPETLLHEIKYAGCAHAWRRQRHHTSVIDRRCTAMISDFIYGQPGALLGFLHGVLDAPGGFGYLFGLLPAPMYATVVSEDLIDESTGKRRIDLTRVKPDYQGEPPLLLYPDATRSLDDIYHHPNVDTANLTYDGLDFPERRVMDLPTFVVHQAGAWSLKWAGGGTNESDSANAKAYQHCTEFWLWLGHHAKQGDKTDALLDNNGGLIIHGLHGAAWEFLEVHMERDYPTPTPALFDLLLPACEFVQSVDFALYVSCVHGIGHSLTFYVTEKNHSISETVAVCAHAAPDGRLVLSCADGFYHEMERAGIFLEPSRFGQHWMPVGVRFPCDHEGPYPLYFECFNHFKIGASKMIANAFRLDSDEPWSNSSSTLSDGKILTSLSAAGQKVWRDTVAFCADVTVYPHFVQRTACMTLFADWFIAQLMFDTDGENIPMYANRLWDVASFELPASALQIQPEQEDDMTPPMLLGNTSTGNSNLGRYVSRTDLPAVVCASASASFWAWLPCAYRSSSKHMHFGVDINPEEAIHSITYETLPARWYSNPWLPTGTGKEETQVAFCNSTWSTERFVDANAMQVAFTNAICVENVRSHGYHLMRVQNASALSSAYSTFRTSGVLLPPSSSAISLPQVGSEAESKS